MDLKRLQGFENLVPVQPGVQKPGAPQPAGGLQKPTDGGPSFKDALNDMLQPAQNKIGTQGITTPTAKTSPARPAEADALKFSNHAVERMQSRGIRFTPEDMTRLNDAVSRAAAKGSKDSLILMKDSALIVSVKNKTVVTVMDKTALKENVFTNIDSTIVM
jgi:flagellar operon protein